MWVRIEVRWLSSQPVAVDHPSNGEFTAEMGGNFYKSITIPTLELPSTEPWVTFELPEHHLNFSSVRFKFGVSLYL